MPGGHLARGDERCSTRRHARRRAVPFEGLSDSLVVAPEAAVAATATAAVAVAAAMVLGDRPGPADGTRSRGGSTRRRSDGWPRARCGTSDADSLPGALGWWWSSASSAATEVRAAGGAVSTEAFRGLSSQERRPS